MTHPLDPLDMQFRDKLITQSRHGMQMQSAHETFYRYMNNEIVINMACYRYTAIV